MATNRSYGNMLNQKLATKNIGKMPQQKPSDKLKESPWVKMGVKK
jgi:hypothetical protein